LKIDLRDSNLTINPVSLRVPGGDFDAQLSLSPDDDGVRAHLAAKVEKFNYGILARRVDPETDMSGLVFLDIELDSKTRYLDRLLQRADGYLDFAVIPHEFESGIIDLWAVGLVSAILPRIGADVSVVNCLIARLDMEDGIMEEDALILDTSKLRATGKATIDFHTEELFVRLEPEAKKPQMFRIEAPIEVEARAALQISGLALETESSGLPCGWLLRRRQPPSKGFLAKKFQKTVVTFVLIRCSVNLVKKISNPDRDNYIIRT
jgi:hypothetical protein